MLGDFAHDFPLPYHGLVSTLNTWLTMLEKGESDQRRLALFLEEDRQIANLIKQYLQTGELNPILDFVLPSTTIERLEFYSDLRRIATRIDSLNSRWPHANQIAFDVEGPEARNVFDATFVDLSAREGRLYYVRDRDSVTAMNVIAYLNEHPETKALMFFGNGHLIRNRVQKDFSGVLTTEERKGMWLGHYLKRAFSDDQVFTISCVGRTRSQLRLDEFAGKDAFLLSTAVPWKNSPPEDNDLVPDNFDAFIIQDGFIVQGHPLRYVFSKRIVDAAIKRLESLIPHRSGAKGYVFLQQAQNALGFLYDTTFSKTDEWRSWKVKHPLDGLNLLRSGELYKRLFDRSSQVLGTPDFGRYIDDLINLGYDPRIGSRTMTHADWEKHLNSQWPQIVFLNAVGIYWIGYPEERETAKAYLVEFSGESFKEPDQYLKWWRMQFYGVAY
jgi:hypothetical protein